MKPTLNQNLIYLKKMSNIIDNQVIENLGDFSQDILFDSQLFKKIKKVDYSITEHSGFNRKLWEKFGLRKNVMYYGLSLKEKALNIEATSNTIEIPLLEKKEPLQRIQKINEKDRCKIGWIYIGSIQMIISATFREGIDTPPKTSTISFQDDFLLDIGDKPKYLDSRPSCSRLTLTNDIIHPSKRIIFNTLEQNKRLQIIRLKANILMVMSGNKLIF